MVSSSDVFELQLPACNARDPWSPGLCSAYQPDDWSHGLLVRPQSGCDWSNAHKCLRWGSGSAYRAPARDMVSGSPEAWWGPSGARGPAVGVQGDTEGTEVLLSGLEAVRDSGSLRAPCAALWGQHLAAGLEALSILGVVPSKGVGSRRGGRGPEHVQPARKVWGPAGRSVGAAPGGGGACRHRHAQRRQGAPCQEGAAPKGVGGFRGPRLETAQWNPRVSRGSGCKI